ncbi:MAG: S46 family peptidase, partial [Planctomycetota bacterium]
ILFAKFALAFVALGASVPASMARPDEGMWLFDGLPLQVLKEKHNFEPPKDWLDHVRLGSVRFDTGGSGSFVSPNGLVMTNHHVALTTIQAVSTPEKDWVEPGFSARLYGQEVPGKGLTLRQLVEIKDVTSEVVALKAADKTPEGNEWREKVEGMTKAAAEGKKNHVADLVTLYDGNQFRIYVYHVFEDVRLVFAPEKQVAFYGGDFDNFTYPRYCLDCAFFRVYEDGKPIDSSKFYFPFDADGAATDELIFVSGHPGSTERSLTHAEMEFQRDLPVPQIVKLLKNRVAAMKKAMDKDPKKAFELRDQYFGASNSLKAYEGHLVGLQTAEMMAKMKARDEDLIQKSGKPEVKAAFDFIAAEMGKLREKFGKKPNLQMMMPAIEEVSVKTCAEAKATINQARFDVYGTANYPDATFTLRLAFGTVKGYEAGTTMVPPKTTLNGLFERNQGFDNKHPYDLPKQWTDKKAKLNLDTPYNFVCTADIIGGISGSPILDRDAKVVGLVFDGNIESLPGNYWFDERVNRCVGVHTAGMLESLRVIYEVAALVQELSGGK